MDPTTVPTTQGSVRICAPDLTPSREERASASLLWLATRFIDYDPALLRVVSPSGEPAQAAIEDFERERAHILDTARSVVTVPGLHSPAGGGFTGRWETFCAAVHHREVLATRRDRTHADSLAIPVADADVLTAVAALYWGAEQNRRRDPIQATA